MVGKNRVAYNLSKAGSPMIQATYFGGKQICAVKMDSAFKDISFERFGGDCTSGYRMCPEGAAQSSSQICIPKGNFGDKCPITSIHFKRKTDTGTGSFEYISYNDVYEIGVSRQSDGLPVTEF